jgi:hypothetical protein
MTVAAWIWDDETGSKTPFRKCKRKCSGGEKCCLRGDVNHHLCICNDATCMCHSQERYDGKLDPVRWDARKYANKEKGRGDGN